MTQPTEQELTQDKYFYSSHPWGGERHPSPIDSLAHDNYDPTFGDNGVSVGADVYECLQCGVAVLNWQKHIEWHEKLREALEIVANALEAIDAAT